MSLSLTALNNWAIHTTLYHVCCIEYTWFFVNAHCYAVLCSLCTSVAFYISGLENKKKIFPIKIYTLLHAFEPIVEALLPLFILIFLAIDKLCGIQSEQIFFTIKCSCNIECMLVPLMPKVVSTSR